MERRDYGERRTDNDTHLMFRRAKLKTREQKTEQNLEYPMPILQAGKYFSLTPCQYSSNMDNSKMFLYWGSGSGPCWKAMISLAEKGLWEGCPNKMISFSNKEHKTDEVFTLNPRGQVPTFRDGDVVVNESDAILMYLEENYSKDGNRLLPTSGPERAQVYQRMFEAQNVQTNIIKELVVYHWRTKPEDRDDKIVKERMEKAKVELGYWEKALNGHAYMVGNNFTLADVAVYPFLAFLMRMGASFREFPALLKYYEAITKRPSVQATWPPHWKEGTTDPILGEL